MKSYNLAVIGGDGTGPEVVREAIKVLDTAAKKFSLKLNYTHYDIGGERYLRSGEVLPDSIVAELRKFPAILLGAIGHPDVKPGILEKGILLRTRFELEQYINLRPVKLYDERFCRMWDFYLAGCEVSFRLGYYVIFQIQLAKRVDSLPITRDYIVDQERGLKNVTDDGRFSKVA